ncbi:MAG: hypothetical protein JO168_22810 [Solirubrobacterales bacterium]|nr:hypothetical protein [Solirubrobacterales bacterium]MBV9717418.1 hypothetical protein [Solirubrobacterales bacterium]
MSSRQERKHEARANRLEREAELRAKARRKRRLAGASALILTAASVAAAIALVASGAARMSSVSGLTSRDFEPLSVLGKLESHGSPGALGPEGVPIPQAPDLTRRSATSASSPVDAIQCLGAEQLLFHIHAHLTVFVNGAATRIPYGIGIRQPQVTATPAGPYVGGGTCFYWLHTHAADGIIHIESPIARTFTLGDFFDVWGQKLGPNRVGPSAGPVTALLGGRVYRGNPRDIPLTAHGQIQLEVGRPLVAPVSITFPAGL